MLEIIPLASGSSGNSWIVRNEASAIMIDAGLSCRKLTARMAARGIDPSSIRALFITHIHRDHISGAGPLVRKYGPEIFVADETWERGRKFLGRIPLRSTLLPGVPAEIDGFSVTPIPVPHDAVEPLAFSVADSAGSRVTIATDLGHATRLVRQYLAESNLIVIESNHDPEMLMTGPYPWPLKQRIRGKSGHLSNHDAAVAVAGALHDGLKGVYLAHLSEENNDPMLAHDTMKHALEEAGAGDLPLLVADQHEPGEFLRITSTEGAGV